MLDVIRWTRFLPLFLFLQPFHITVISYNCEPASPICTLQQKWLKSVCGIAGAPIIAQSLAIINSAASYPDFLF